jgi:hypothetical protein
MPCWTDRQCRCDVAGGAQEGPVLHPGLRWHAAAAADPQLAGRTCRERCVKHGSPVQQGPQQTPWPTLQGSTSATPTSLPPTSSLAPPSATRTPTGRSRGCRLAFRGTRIIVSSHLGQARLESRWACSSCIYASQAEPPTIHNPGSLANQTTKRQHALPLHCSWHWHPQRRRHWRGRQCGGRSRRHWLGCAHIYTHMSASTRPAEATIQTWAACHASAQMAERDASS